VVEVVHAVPDRLQDPIHAVSNCCANNKKRDVRSERSDTNTSTDEEDRLVIKELLRRSTKGTVNHDTRKSAVHRGVGVRADNLATGGVLAALVPLRAKVASEGLGERRREITLDTDVD
jgi:hypothetical protein